MHHALADVNGAYLAGIELQGIFDPIQLPFMRKKSWSQEFKRYLNVIKAPFGLCCGKKGPSKDKPKHEIIAKEGPNTGYALS